MDSFPGQNPVFDTLTLDLGMVWNPWAWMCHDGSDSYVCENLPVCPSNRSGISLEIKRKIFFIREAVVNAELPVDLLRAFSCVHVGGGGRRESNTTGSNRYPPPMVTE